MANGMVRAGMAAALGLAVAACGSQENTATINSTDGAGGEMMSNEVVFSDEMGMEPRAGSASGEAPVDDAAGDALTNLNTNGM